MRLKNFCFLVVCLFLISCNNNKLNNDANKNNVNRLNPTLMVFPSDALLKRLDCIKELENQGITSYDRNYAKSFIQDSELKFVIASIDEAFTKANYPLENLEQQLKQINNEKASGCL